MNLYCNQDSCWKSYLVCLFKCTRYVKKRCSVYKEQVEEILSQPVPGYYIDKYGPLDEYRPNEVKKRKIHNVLKDASTVSEVRTEKVADGLTVSEIEEDITVKLPAKSTRKVKATVMSTEKDKPEVIEEEPKKKRKRRTKAEMEEARKVIPKDEPKVRKKRADAGKSRGPRKKN